MKKLVVTVLLAAAIILTSPTSVRAQEVVYVTDLLRLGMHRARDTSDTPFRNLVSGTELTILERVPNYARVRTPDGEEGWVRSAFLVTEKPARLRVAELTAALEEARAELAVARSARLDVEKSTGRMNEELSRKIAAAEAIQQEFTRLQNDNEAMAVLVERYRGALPLPWVAGALVVVFAGGLLTGIWWVDRSIRRRFGGHRIY